MNTTLEHRKTTTVSVLRLFFWIALSINGISAIIGMKNAWGLGSLLGFSGSMLLALWPCFLISFICILGLVLQYSRHFRVMDNLTKKILDAISRLRGFGIILFLVLLLLTLLKKPEH